ncbi:MAG TPA: CCXG family PEP-CTERM protein [Methylophilaceae bacterium]|nr:CCXG family PEP-CTERM protein [Methylophilaceae bacterium]
MNKNAVKLSIATLALVFLGSANASTTKIETGYLVSGPLASAADYVSAVDVAVAVATPGYGSTYVSAYDNISNQNLFGSNVNTAFKSTVDFSVSSADAGLWEIRSGVDFGNGGALFVDGTAYAFATNDMWWAGNYNNASQYFSISLNLSAGNHVLNIYGLEACCDGFQQAQFKSFTSNGFTTFSTTDGLTAAVPEPETYGMMLAGLGLMGFMVRRRKIA